MERALGFVGMAEPKLFQRLLDPASQIADLEG
jgi:hypothetical protein